MTYMIQEEDRDDLLFATIPGCGPTTYHRLRSHFGTSALVNAITAYAEKRVVFGLKQLQIGFIGYHSERYPERLRELSDAPIGLFYMEFMICLRRLKHEEFSQLSGLEKYPGMENK